MVRYTCFVIATQAKSARPSERSSGPMAIGPIPVAPGTPSKSPVSPSRQRGRDLETEFSIEPYALTELLQKTELHT